MKFLKILGYTILALLVLGAALFGALYARYTSQSSEIHRVVSGFMTQVHSGNSQTIRPYIHPDFVEPLDTLLNEHGELFSSISRFKEKHWYFSYNVSSDTGETTVYQGLAYSESGDVADLMVKLIRLNGLWVVYGVNLKLHQM